ncbi:MAG: DnaD domain protein [Oscillospiraceae bacterium]|jgi:DnaD/phage-associated family protein|nr:DnaD domain protein [Oscillospiraceae bacterium]
MKFSLPGPDAVTVSGQAIDKLVGSGDGDAALVYLYILRTQGAGTLEQAAGALGRTRDAVSAAMSCLNKMGLITYDAPRRAAAQARLEQGDELPEYTAADIERCMRDNLAFRELVGEVEKALGKVLSSDDTTRLFGIYDNLGLPPEVILHLVNYCIVCGRNRDGTPRTPTVRYIEKAAYTWERAGVFSLDRAEEFIKELEGRRSASSAIRSALKIGQRELSPTEQRYVDSWLDMGFGPESAEIAYDRTVLNTGKLTWSYMDKIMNNWHGKGLHTVDEINRGDSKPTRSQAFQKGHAAPNTEELRRMERLLGNL